MELRLSWGPRRSFRAICVWSSRGRDAKRGFLMPGTLLGDLSAVGSFKSDDGTLGSVQEDCPM